MLQWIKRLKYGPARHISWRVFFEVAKRSGYDEMPDTPLYYKVENIEVTIFTILYLIGFSLFIGCVFI